MVYLFQLTSSNAGYLLLTLEQLVTNFMEIQSLTKTRRIHYEYLQSY